MLVKLNSLARIHFVGLCIVFSLLITVIVVYSSHVFAIKDAKFVNEIADNSNKQKNIRAIGEHLKFESSKFEADRTPISENNLTTYLNSNQSIVLDNQSILGGYMLSSILYDPFGSCNTDFTCISDSSTGWKDNTSFQVSTTDNTKNKWSSIRGQELDAKPGERYWLITHMKMNQWATLSHIALEGYDNSTKEWYQIQQCPAGTNGPLEWREFRCTMTIPENTTKIRPLLNAGWSSDLKKEGTTWFDEVNMTKFKPFLADSKLTTQLVYQGLDGPIGMAFLGPNDFLVTEVNGTVQRIANGTEFRKPVLDLQRPYVTLLGIAINKNTSKEQPYTINEPAYVFLYFNTYNKWNHLTQQSDVSNRLYRYDLVNNTLVNAKLLLDLPAGFDHDGGPISIAPDQSVYLSVGDTENETYHIPASKALNDYTGADPDGIGGILRVTQDGLPVEEGVLGNKNPLNLYYAYGIRESFGMDFDPVTGKLWDTENGANWGDEINLVEPGFNSGWNKVQGIWSDHIREDNLSATNIVYNPSNLVDFGGKGKYRTPEFTWRYTVGPTALKFLTTTKLGKQYENDMLVADSNNGRIYHFKLNENRTSLLLQGPLMDKVADTDMELDQIIFARDFGLITDLKIGPDGYLYFVVFDEGKIFKILPKHNLG